MLLEPAAVVGPSDAATAAHGPPANVTPYSPSAIAPFDAGSYDHEAPGARSGPLTMMGVANCAARRKRTVGERVVVPAFWMIRRVVAPFTFFCT